MTKNAFRGLLAGALLAAGLAGSHAALAGGTHGKAFTFGEPGTRDHVDRTIRVTARDTEFGTARIDVRAGETVRFVVTNDGEIDHDFTIGPAKLQAAHRKEMTAMMDGGAMAKMHDDPNAVYLRPGETGELIWTFADSGRLEFACNVPGHYESGMKGTLRVGGDSRVEG